jgi:iron complex outermembrane recepter protein
MGHDVSKKFVGSVLLVATASVCDIPIAAGQSNEAAANQETVVVTGSRIRRTEAETSSPLEIISAEDIEKTGQSNIADIVREISSNNQGSIVPAFTGGFAPGAAGVSLRGLGVNSTLVLVNGRRMAPFGLADDGSRTFVDLNSLPLEAVERVEVLKDGASAVYGSDAIAGVVNIILRQTYQGASLGGNVGTSGSYDGSSTRVNGAFGMGDLSTDRYNFFVTAEGSKQDAIAQDERSDYLGTRNLSSFGFFDNRIGAPAAGRGAFSTGGPNFSAVTPYGTVRVPGGSLSQRINLTPCPEVHPTTGVCTFDLIAYDQIQPKMERANFYGRGTYGFSEDMQGYVELGYFHTKTEFIGTPGSVNDTGVFNPADPFNPVTPAHQTILPANHPDNPLGVDTLLSLLTADLGGRNGTTDSNVTRAVVGLQGVMLSDWSYQAGAGYIESKLDQSQTGFVFWPALQAALNDGSYRINNPSAVSAETYAAISPTLKNTAKNSIALVDGSISSELFDLPGGALGFAVGAEYRKEKTNSPPVPGTDTGDIVGLGFSAFSSDRDIYAGYIEAIAPVTNFLELNAAYRYDHYSDYGHSSTPKVGFKVTPIPQLAIRGTYAEGFRAPGPTESGNSSSLAFTPQLAVISIGDTNVKPETSKSYTLGLVTEPLPGSSASVDFYRIDRKNEITSADPASITAGLPLTGDPLTRIPGAVAGSFLYYDSFGDLATVSGGFTNANATITSGIDFDLRQTLNFDNIGRFDAGLVWTYILGFKKTLSTGDSFEYTGTHGPFSLSSAGGTPRNRGAFQLTWTGSEKLSLTGRVNYVSGMKMIDHLGETIEPVGDGTFTTTTVEGLYFNVDPNGVVCGVYNPDGSPANGDCRVSSFTTFDLSGRYDFTQNLRITASVLNALNKQAPFDPYTYGGTNYNPAFNQAGAVGRFLSVGAKYSF